MAGAGPTPEGSERQAWPAERIFSLLTAVAKPGESPESPGGRGNQTGGGSRMNGSKLGEEREVPCRRDLQPVLPLYNPAGIRTHHAAPLAVSQHGHHRPRDPICISDVNQVAVLPRPDQFDRSTGASSHRRRSPQAIASSSAIESPSR